MKYKPRPPTIRDGDDVFQREANRFAKVVTADAQESRVYTRGVTVTSTGTQVKHGLGRIPVGFQVSWKTAVGDIWVDVTQTLTPDTITLVSSVGSLTVDLIFW